MAKVLPFNQIVHLHIVVFVRHHGFAHNLFDLVNLLEGFSQHSSWILMIDSREGVKFWQIMHIKKLYMMIVWKKPLTILYFRGISRPFPIINVFLAYFFYIIFEPINGAHPTPTRAARKHENRHFLDLLRGTLFAILFPTSFCVAWIHHIGLLHLQRAGYACAEVILYRHLIQGTLKEGDQRGRLALLVREWFSATCYVRIFVYNNRFPWRAWTIQWNFPRTSCTVQPSKQNHRP